MKNRVIYMCQPIMTTRPRTFGPFIELGTQCKAFQLPLDTARGPEHKLTHKRISHVNVIVIISYHDHTYPKTCSAFKRKSSRTCPVNQGS